MSLLQHALDSLQEGQECADPDCELHNIVVACEEEVVSGTQVAFFLAGVHWMYHNFNAVSPSTPVRDLLAKLP